MSGVATAIAGGAIVGGLISSKSQRGAAREATEAQTEANRAAIEEQRRQFDRIQELLSPYVEAGTGALGAQQALLGLGGPEAQAEAIAGLEGSPMFEALTRQGEEAILQSASATGGLRGGNVQRALAQFRPQVLSQVIESQYGKLAGLTDVGQASAAGVGSAGQRTGAAVGGLMQDIGQAQALGAGMRGAAGAQLAGDITGALTGLIGNEQFRKAVF